MGVGMNSDETILRRIAELEAELERLRRARLSIARDGTMLKLLLDDIARRRHVEADLRQAQLWLTLAQEAGQVAAYTFDFATGKLDWSASTLALYGFAPDQEPTLEGWLNAIHPDDRAGAAAVASAALQRHQEVDQRFRIVRADGSFAWIQDRGRIVRHADGSPARLVGINVDVTDLIALEQSASGDSDRLRLALAAGRNACWDWDLVTGRVEWDSELATLTGIHDFGGDFQSFWALVHDEDKPKVRAALDHALASGADYSAEFRMVRSDGSIRWTATRARVVRDESGRPLRLVGIDSDTTEQRAAQAALLESRLFLESVLAATPDCIKVIEADGCLSYMNDNGRAAMEIADFAAVQGRRWSELWPADTVPRVEAALARALKGERSRFEGLCPTAAGTAKWWDVSVAPIVGEGGRVERIVAISRDISERRRSDEQIQTLNAELHHRIKNNLATVQALARSTLRNSRDMAAFGEAFFGRLEALGRTYDLLHARPEATTIRELVETELEPFGGASDRIAITGPELPVPAARAVALGMILHELTTNAAKYGALAAPEGRLAVAWGAQPGGARIDWAESAPDAALGAPGGSGFGSVLVDRLARQLGATIAREWRSEGLRVGITLPEPRAS